MKLIELNKENLKRKVETITSNAKKVTNNISQKTKELNTCI